MLASPSAGLDCSSPCCIPVLGCGHLEGHRWQPTRAQPAAEQLQLSGQRARAEMRRRVQQELGSNNDEISDQSDLTHETILQRDGHSNALQRRERLILPRSFISKRFF
jgi:hypothetical protein